MVAINESRKLPSEIEGHDERSLGLFSSQNELSFATCFSSDSPFRESSSN